MTWFCLVSSESGSRNDEYRAAAGCFCCQTGHHGHVHHPSAKHPHSRTAAAHLHRAGRASQRASGRCGRHRSGLPGHRPQAQRRGVAGRDRLVCMMAWNETSCSQLCSFMIELLSVVSYRDAPKWKFLAEAEAKQNKTLGQIPNTVFRHFFPHVGLFCHLFSPLHELNSQNVLFTVLSCFSNKKINYKTTI